MALFENQNTGVDDILAAEELKRKEAPQVTAPLTETKTTDLNEPVDIEQELRKIYFPEDRRPKGGYGGQTQLTNQDFYPEGTGLNYVQTPGGLAAIAPKGALIPFGAIAQMQNEKARTDAAIRAKKELANTWDIDVGHINQAEIDAKFQDLYINTYNQSKSELSKKYGDNWVMAMKQDPNYLNRFNKLKQLSTSINSDLALATKYLEESKDNPVYKDPESIKQVNSFLGAYDNLMSGLSDDPKQIDKWYELIQENRDKIIEQRDIGISIGEYAKSLNQGVKESFNQYKAEKALGNSENDILNSVTSGSPFMTLTKDKNGMDIWQYDDKKANDSWAGFYEETYGVVLQKDVDGNYIKDNGKYVIDSYSKKVPAPDVNKFVTSGIAATKSELKAQVNALNTKRYEYWAKSQDLKQSEVKPLFESNNNQTIQLPNNRTVKADVTNITNQTYDKKTGKQIFQPVVSYAGTIDGVDINGNPVRIANTIDKQPVAIYNNVSDEDAKLMGLPKGGRITKIQINDPNYDAKVKAAQEDGTTYTGSSVIEVFEPFQNELKAALNTAGVAVENVNYDKEGKSEFVKNPRVSTQAIPNPKYKGQMVTKDINKEPTLDNQTKKTIQGF